ncbi:unnamed protein product [Pleuronectes platessa]|uniref:Uncharacterized protein n=1 Tax=Pleuronectes platessa TaxID=8262 RepID=A0A9N7UJP1_PLEPL|nr:unnamed protein product [Pleuronectes platessa]
MEECAQGQAWTCTESPGEQKLLQFTGDDGKCSSGNLIEVLLFDEHTRTTKETLGGSRLEFGKEPALFKEKSGSPGLTSLLTLTTYRSPQAIRFNSYFKHTELFQQGFAQWHERLCNS